MSNSNPDLENLNRWWNCNDTPPVWKARWILLWCADIALRGRTFIWRIIANGLFTNARAGKFITGVGKCDHCNAPQETIQHIFFQCPFAQEVWRNVTRFFGASETQNMVSTSSNFLDLLDHCLGPKATDTARMIILYETAFLIWKTRNNQVFQGQDRILSSHHIACSARLHALALLTYSKSKTKVKRLSSALKFIESHIERNASRS